MEPRHWKHPSEIDAERVRSRVSRKALKGKWCSMFAREAAELLFGHEYAPADAWELGKANRQVWQKAGREGFKDTEPGNMLGIYVSNSPHNRLGVPYTHVALYLGDGYILHNLGGNIRHEKVKDLISEYKPKGVEIEVRAVIAPKQRTGDRRP